MNAWLSITFPAWPFTSLTVAVPVEVDCPLAGMLAGDSVSVPLPDDDSIPVAGRFHQSGGPTVSRTSPRG